MRSSCVSASLPVPTRSILSIVLAASSRAESMFTLNESSTLLVLITTPIVLVVSLLNALAA